MACCAEGRKRRLGGARFPGMLSAAVLALALAQAGPLGSPAPATPLPVASPAGSPPAPAPAGPPMAQPLPAAAAATADQPDLAVIVNSGSTNTAGYTLRVRESGWTTLEQGGAPVRRKRVAEPLVTRLFADLRAAGSLAALPRGRCMKSVSFGSVTTVAYHGETSSDLSCPSGSSAASALAHDADALRDAVGVAPFAPRRQPLP